MISILTKVLIFCGVEITRLPKKEEARTEHVLWKTTFKSILSTEDSEADVTVSL